MAYKVIIYRLNSRKQCQIIDVMQTNIRSNADCFVSKYMAEIMPDKLATNTNYYKLSHT